jgi:hypothetical protein
MGRHTITGLLSTHGRILQDWSADYRMYQSPQCDPDALFRSVRRELLQEGGDTDPIVVALDDTRLRKSGRHTHGVKYTRDPMGPPFHVNFIRAQRFLQLSMAAVAPDGDARMVPIELRHTPTPKKPRHDAGEEAFAAYRKKARETALPIIAAQRVCRLREELDLDGHEQRRLWTVVDGGYTNRNYLKGVPGHCTVVGRIRADAKLYHLPEDSTGKTGRNRVYGKKAPTPRELLEDECVPWEEIKVHVSGTRHTFRAKAISPLRWRSAGKEHDLKLVVIAPLRYRLSKGQRILYRQPAFLSCTDPEASLQEILQHYVRRWDIEVNFRDEKTTLGVGEAQVRTPDAVEKVPALAVAAYASLLTAAIRTFGHKGLPDVLPRPKWQNKKPRRASTQQLVNHLRQEVWASSIRFSSFVQHRSDDTKREKQNPSLASAVFYASATP